MTKPADRIPLGVAFMLGFTTIAPLIDVFSKLASQAVPVGEVTLARFVVQAALMVPLVLWYGQGFRMGRRAFWLTVVRAVVSILSTYTFVAAVQVMPIADALAIVFVEPFIILLLGWLVYQEQVGPRRLGAAVVGFLGSLLVIQPSFAHFGVIALFPLATALFFALYIIVTRQLAPLMHPVAMQSHTAIVAMLLWAPVVFLAEGSGIASLDPVWPQGLDWLWLFGVGAAATASHMSMSFGLRLAPAATLAPLHYLEIVTAAVLGYLVFGDFPNALTWAGITVIIASGLYVIHRERVLDRRARTEAASLTATALMAAPSDPPAPHAAPPAAGSPASALPKS